MEFWKRERHLEFETLIKYPPVPEKDSSLRPMEKILLGNFLMLVRPQLVVELGVYRGATTEFMIDFLATNDIKAKVVGFDVPVILEELRAGNPRIAQLEAENKLELVSGYLPDSLADWLKRTPQSIDVALVDALHEYQAVMSELTLLWPQLAAAGVILCHDYSTEVRAHEGVSFAVDRFAQRTRDAHVLSLRSAPTADAYLVDGQTHTYHSVLVALRKRPYQASLQRMMPHMLRYYRWRGKRMLRRVLPSSILGLARRLRG